MIFYPAFVPGMVVGVFNAVVGHLYFFLCACFRVKRKVGRMRHYGRAVLPTSISWEVVVGGNDTLQMIFENLKISSIVFHRSSISHVSNKEHNKK